MREELKAARALEKLKALGVPITMTHDEVKSATREIKTKKADPSYDAEAVLMFLQQPARFMFKACKRTECGESFGTNYRSVAYCSDNCRRRDLEVIGITWDPTKQPEERWGGEPPILIPPTAMRKLLEWAQTQRVEQAFAAVVFSSENLTPVLTIEEYKAPQIVPEVDPDTIDQSQPISSTSVYEFLEEVRAFEL